jgi:hypothetical protein
VETVGSPTFVGRHFANIITRRKGKLTPQQWTRPERSERGSAVRSRLIWNSILGGGCITILAIALRMFGIAWPVRYLSYPGIYLMQSFLQRFLDWLPGGFGMNLIAETLTFIIANTLSFALVIFLVLRIFIPDRSEELSPIVAGK